MMRAKPCGSARNIGPVIWTVIAVFAALWGLTAGSGSPQTARAGSAEKEELEFKTDAGEKAFEDGVAAFKQKKFSEAGKLLAKAKSEAKNAAAKAELARWAAGMAGLKDLLLLEQKVDSRPGWVYENAQRKYLVNIGNPAGEFFQKLLDELEKPEKKLVQKIEGFEASGPYDAKFGKTFVHRVKEPAHVIEGDRSLRWECKDRQCLALKISNVPADWSPFEYLGFWLYGERGKSSELEVYVSTAVPKGKKVSRTQRSFNGYQAKLPSHTGWKYVTLPLPASDKESSRSSQGSFRRVGSGDLTKISSIQFQLSTVKRFLVYFDDIVLVRRK